MQSLNYWKQFEYTGRVEDYLSYVEKESAAPQKVGNTSETGVNPYAGVHMGDRNDFKADACRGI